MSLRKVASSHTDQKERTFAHVTTVVGNNSCHVWPVFLICLIFLPRNLAPLNFQTLAVDFAFFVMSNYADNWTSTPWQTPDPLQAVQHLQSLLCTAESDTRDQNVPQKVCTVVGDILAKIEEKIKSHCKHKHLTHVEHRVDATTGRDLVRVWKCTDVQGCAEYSYDSHSCPEGVYYDWQKIVVNIWIKLRLTLVMSLYFAWFTGGMPPSSTSRLYVLRSLSSSCCLRVSVGCHVFSPSCFVDLLNEKEK